MARLAAAAIVLTSAVTVAGGQPTTTCPNQFVTAVGDGTLRCGDDPFRFIGVNIRELIHFDRVMWFACDPGDDDCFAAAAAAEIREQLGAARAMGATVVRFSAPHHLKDTDEILGDMGSLFAIASQATPDMKFIVTLTDFYARDPGSPDNPRDQPDRFVVQGDHDDGAYAADGDLSRDWFTPSGTLRYTKHYLPFVEALVARFWNENKILAWELGNELTVRTPSAPGLMTDFVYAVGNAIRDKADEVGEFRQMVTTGFLGVNHAIGGNVTGAIQNEIHLVRNGNPSPIDFGSVHLYNNEWTNPPCDPPCGLSDFPYQVQDLDFDFFRQRDVPYIVGELGFQGAFRTPQCGADRYPGGRWGDVTFPDIPESRSQSVQLVLDRMFSEFEADGAMPWAFESGDANGSGDACSGMDSGTHLDFDDLAFTYGCRARILEQDNSAADLTIRSVTEEVLTERRTIRFTIVVHNGGSEASGNSGVGVYIGPLETDPFATGSQGGRGVVPRLNPGDRATITIEWRPTEKDDFTVIDNRNFVTAAVVIDNPRGEAGSTSCNNGYYKRVEVPFCPVDQFGLGSFATKGCRPTPPPTPRDHPDLTPTAILFDSADLVEGSAVFFDSGVRNLGQADSGAFDVRWLVDGLEIGAAGAHQPVPARQTVLNGNSQLLWNAVAGTHEITFEVDFTGRVEESNERNNLARKTVTVAVNPDGRADLVPTAITFGSVFVEGQEVLVDSGVANLGDTASGVFNVEWLVDGQSFGAAGSHAGVAAGDTVLDGNSELRWTALGGIHTLTFVVDSDDFVDERDETNNERTVAVDVEGAPRITNEAFTPRLVPGGLVYTHTLEVDDPNAGEVFDFALTEGPTGMAIDAAGTIDWTAFSSGIGRVFPVSAEVSDGLFSDSQSFDVQTVHTLFFFTEPQPLGNSFTVFNRIDSTGTANLVLGTVSLTGPDAGEEMRIVDDQCSGAVLPPGTSCFIFIDIVPTSIGTKASTVVIPTNVFSIPVLYLGWTLDVVEPVAASVESATGSIESSTGLEAQSTACGVESAGPAACLTAGGGASD